MNNVFSNKYTFVPKSFPHLAQFVRQINWNCVAKTLEIIIEETQEFDVFKWIEYINHQNHETEMSPFVDVDMNGANLTFYNEDGDILIEFTFKDLVVEDHNCLIAKSCVPCSDVNTYLTYKIIIFYASLDHKLSTE